MTREDLDALRRHGFGDTALHDAAQIVSLFNHFNRVADALGLEPETFIRPWEQALR
jgi:alkylhydroperoxidase family enzyme